MEVMAVLSELKITITNINAKVQEDTKNVSINLVVDIRDISQLDFVMTKLRRIREVYTVTTYVKEGLNERTTISAYATCL